MKEMAVKGAGTVSHAGRTSAIVLTLLAALSLAAVWLRPSSAENGVIEISTLEQLETFRDNVNKGISADAKVMLTADIDLGGQSAPWTPIGYYSMIYDASNDTFEIEENTFKGVFD